MDHDDPLRTALAFASTMAGRRRAEVVREALVQASGAAPVHAWSTPQTTPQGRWAQLTVVNSGGRWLGEYRDSAAYHELVVYADEREALAWSDDIRRLLTEAGWL